MAALISVLLALVVAFGVILLASVSPDRADGDGVSPWQAFRRGWRLRKAPVVVADPVDVSLAEMLAGADDGGQAYMSTDELATTFDRARDRAVEQTTRAAEIAGRAVPGHHASSAPGRV